MYAPAAAMCWRRTMGKERCKECVFRGTPGKNMCDYAWLTGKTRKAQPAEKYS